jgi:uncharacterized protein (TIGR02466 family)
MIFIKPVTPFLNSIYEIYDLSLDLNLIQTGVEKHLQNPNNWYNRGYGKQTINLTDVIPEFESLFEKLDDSVAGIVKSWGIEETPKLSLYFINIDNNYSAMESHCHANCILSGVFYVSVPEGSGSINFYRPDNQEYQFKAHTTNNPYLNRKYTINPIPNMAVIFPPHIKHGVEVSKLQENDSRISISFDYTL